MKKLLGDYFITLLKFERLCSVMSKFYGVKVGRVPGVYEKWADAFKNIQDFPKPEFRKFDSRREALDFVNGKQTAFPKSFKASPSPKSYKPSTSSKSHKSLAESSTVCTCVCQCGAFPGVPLSRVKRNVETNHQVEPCPKQLKSISTPVLSSKSVHEETKNELSNLVHVYTDGACSGNGRKNSNGGIGVFWGPNHPMNVSEPLLGRQTNNRAEIMAAVKALQQAKSMGYENIALHTDSQFLINGITKWIIKWKKNGWKLVNGKEVINKEDFLALDEAQKGLNVEYKYVKGHSGNLGNEAADQLAVEEQSTAQNRKIIANHGIN